MTVELQLVERLVYGRVRKELWAKTSAKAMFRLATDHYEAGQLLGSIMNLYGIAEILDNQGRLELVLREESSTESINPATKVDDNHRVDTIQADINTTGDWKT